MTKRKSERVRWEALLIAADHVWVTPGTSITVFINGLWFLWHDGCIEVTGHEFSSTAAKRAALRAARKWEGR